MPVGTTGESPTLSHDEHKRVVEVCIEVAAGRVPVIAGAGSNNTTEAIDLARFAEEAGADGLLVVTPYYNKPNQEGLYQHYKAINDAVGIPIIIYNIPPRSVIDMSVETMARLFELKNIAGVKDATARIERVSLQRHAMGARVQPAFRRGRHRACLHGAWRPRLHLGHVERGAQAAVGVPGRVPGGRLRHGARLSGPADAAASGAVHRAEPGRRQIRAVGDRQDERRGATAAGQGVGSDARRDPRRHGACRPDQLIRWPRKRKSRRDGWPPSTGARASTTRSSRPTRPGIALAGTEVKSLREGQANIADAYAGERGGELWLYNAHIPEYLQANRFQHAPRRARKLLLHKREINRLIGAVNREGMTIVPLKIYFNDRGRAKVELAVARGKKLHDKRETEKKRSWEREKARVMREKG